MNYQESIDWLYGTQTFGIKLGLENVRRLLEELGVTEALRGRKIIHVAGTNGKGSVCAFSERILRDGGLRTGLFTSPHLVTYRERIRVGGSLIPEEAAAGILTRIRKLAGDWEQHPTFFEISLALALRWFCDQDCDAIVLETGMGGRLDATNALVADLSVITSLSLDHQQWLGETLREIAVEKAGILKREVPVIIGELPPEARDVIGRRALALGIPCIEAHPLPPEWETGLRGPHQRENAALAVEAACRIEGERLTQEGIRRSLAITTWPGRFQCIEGDLYLDGAHNPEAAETLRRTWEAECPGEQAHLIFGAVRGKDIAGIFRAFLPVISAVTFVPVKSERRLSAGEMRSALVEAGGGKLPAYESADLFSAIAKARRGGGKTLVAGSLFLVGETLGHFLGEHFEVSLQ